MLATREGKALFVVWLLGGTVVNAVALRRHFQRGQQRAARRKGNKTVAAANTTSDEEHKREAEEGERDGGAKTRKVREEKARLLLSGWRCHMQCARW